MTASIIHNLSRALHSTDDPGVGGTPTHVACHAVDDLLFGWLRILCKKGRCLHDLTRLAITTLRHLILDPSLLHGVRIACVEAFDRGDEFSFDGSDRDRAGAYRLAIDMNGAGPAHSNPAPVFGASES
jgi:hypothetical protein